MKMGISPEHISKSLVCYNHTRAYFFTGNFSVEIAYHGKYHFRYYRKKLSIVAEEHPQDFWECKDKLTV